jgi:hypothetical protein
MEDQGAVSDSAARLSWVHKSNGRLVPFEPDQISRDLFAATERLGRPDAFLARELTDSVLHFLALETEGTIPTTAQIVDVVVKVVRELGHPRLAQAFAERGVGESAVSEDLPLGPALADVARWVQTEPSPVQLARQLSRATLRDYSLRAVFSRDLAAAHTAGLLTLGNLDAPLELAGHALGPVEVGSVSERMAELRHITAEVLALDAPEYALLEAGEPERAAAAFVRQLQMGIATTGLRVVVNLNCAVPPPGAAELGDGPLFAGQRAAPDPAHRLAVADAIREQMLGATGGIPQGTIRIDWHLGEADMAASRSGRLLRVAAQAAESAAIAFVFDRPRRGIALAEGLDRQHPASLMNIGLNLPVLRAQPGVGLHSETFIAKLGSLVRLAFSAAAQKRDFLRRHGAVRPGLVQGFQLDRARLVLVPVGLEAVVRQLAGHAAADPGGGTPLARAIVASLHAAIRQEAPPRCLEASLDSAAGFSLEQDGERGTPLERIAGLTAWDAQIALRPQVRTAGMLHSLNHRGTAAILYADQATPSAEKVVELLRAAWQQGDVCRLRLVRLNSSRRQLPALWEG